jgi:shikimate dehydrogenase
MTTRILPAVPAIDGKTRLIAIVGDPIAQVRSPLVFNPRLAEAGHNAVLVPLHIPASRFDEIMPALMGIPNLAGLVITVPFKERATALAKRLGTIGARVGAINAMRPEGDGSWTGDMFDGAGLVAALRGLGQEPAGRKVLLLGAGGAGSAIAMALADAGAAEIRIFDLMKDRAERLASRVRQFYPHCAATAGPPELEDRDLLINATPVGMAPDYALPRFTGDLHRGLTVVDIVPTPERTKLLEAAAAARCPTANGQGMIAGQADAIMRFLGLPPAGG